MPVSESVGGIRVRRVVAVLFAVYAVALAAMSVRDGSVPGVEELLLFLFAAALFGNRVGRFLRDWSLVVAGIFAYATTGRFAAGLDAAVHYTPQIDAERAVTFGAMPTLWLQDHLYRGGTGPLEAFAVVMYLSHFFAPLLLAFYLWWRRSKGFTELMFTLLVLSIFAEITFVLAPTAPPWLAAQHGLLPDVHHILRQGLFDLHLDELGSMVGDSSRYNVVAAFPSLHAGFPIACLLVAIAYGLPRWILIAQATQMLGIFFAVIYSGDHYFVDVLGGAVYALAAWAVVHLAFSAGRAHAPAARRAPATPAPVPVEASS